MSPFATVRSLRQARRIIKSMNCQVEGWSGLEEAGREGVRRAMEAIMTARRARYLEEIESSGLEDRANGHYRRHLLTGMGDIELQVPRTRRWSAMEKIQAYARRSSRVDQSILSCFVLGLSTRKVSRALLPIFGERISPSTVSRVAKQLDQVVEAFHRRPLANDYSVLLFDGVVLSQKTGAGAQRRPVLVVLGIRPNGRKEVIDFLQSSGESQTAWEGLLNDLYRRGLTGEGVELITIDGCRGLAQALQTVYPRIPIQRCWAHKVRNVTDKVRKSDVEAIKKDLRRIFLAANRGRALEAFVRFGAIWEERYPGAVRCVKRDIVELLSFFKFQDLGWQRATRTTNAIERRFREVKRRTRPMGVMSDRSSVERILFAVFYHLNEEQKTATPFLLTQNS